MNHQVLMLPPGFRFHPTDEELIIHYLLKKVLDPDFTAVSIAEVDMNKVEPWELPWRAKNGEKEWYFFSVRDKKYPSGVRTNRATSAGYWKATGKDKEIFSGRPLVGMKKTLVFYLGRAPKGEKTNWVSHEYRLVGDPRGTLIKSAKNDWVISRVSHKTCGGEKVCTWKPAVNTPPLIEPETGHVHCFSAAAADNPSDQSNLFSVQSEMENPIPSQVWAPYPWWDVIQENNDIVSVSGENAPSIENSSGVLNPGAEDLDFKWRY